MKRWIWMLFAIAWLVPTTPRAQIVNVQSLLLNTKAPGFRWMLSAEGSWSTGNVNYLLFKGSALMRVLHKKHMLILTASGSYATNNDQDFVKQVFEHIRYRIQLFDLLGIEAFAQHEFDEFKRLSLRALWGIGPRLSLFRDRSIRLFIGSAYMFEINKLSRSPKYNDSDALYLYHRWSNYLTLQFKLSKTLQIIHTTYIQPDFRDFGNLRLLLDTTLGIKLNKWLGMTLSHNLSYQSSPPAPEGIKKLDSLLLLGLQISFGTQKSTKKPPKKTCPCPPPS